MADSPGGKVVGIGGGSWLRLGQEQVASSDDSTEAAVAEGAAAVTAGKSGGITPRAMSASLEREGFLHLVRYVADLPRRSGGASSVRDGYVHNNAPDDREVLCYSSSHSESDGDDVLLPYSHGIGGLQGYNSALTT